MRERALDVFPAQPPEQRDELPQRGAAGAAGRVDDALRAGRRDRRAHEILDVLGAAGKHVRVTAVDAGQRIDDTGGGPVGAVERGRQRRDGVLVADLPERFGGLIADHFVGQQRQQPRRDAGVVDPRQRIQRRKGQEEVVRLGDRGQRFNRRRRAQLAERFNGVKPDVHVRIVECHEQRLDRFRTVLRAEGERRLDAQIGVGVLQQIDQRRGQIDPGHRQQLQRAAQHAEIAVPLAQRRDQRLDQAGIAPAGDRLHRGSPHPPVLVGHRRRQRTEAVDRVERGQAFDRPQPQSGIAVAQFVGQLVLDVEPLGHILDGDDQADRAAALDQRGEPDPLLHVLVARRWR